jgi:hypothetical protein
VGGRTLVLRAEVPLRESPDGTGRENCTTQGELNLEEVGKGRKPASNLLPVETLAEVDFYCFRPPDLTLYAFRQLAFLGAPGASITRVEQAEAGST